MIEFVLVWYNERCEICRCWQGCFILSPCTLNQLLVADILGTCPWTDWPVNLTAWLWICDGNSIVSRARRFVFAVILATSTPAASLPWMWCPSRFTMTSFTSVWSWHWQLRITHLQNFFLLPAEKAWKVNMNPASMRFLLSREVSVLSMTQIWKLAWGCAVQAYMQRVATSKGVERELV